MNEGWKYFELENLNHLFKLKYDETIKTKILQPVKLTQSEHQLGTNISVRLGDHDRSIMLNDS